MEVKRVKPTILANAITTVGLGVYVACRILSLVMPNFLFKVGRSWFHTFNVDALKATAPFNFGTFLFGAITFGIFVWITTYVAAALYKDWSK